MQQQQGITRRGFTGALLSGAVAAATGRSAGAWANSRRPRIAFLGTVVFQHSHAQHFLDRFAMGQSWRGQLEAPRLDVAGIFLDQVRDDDLGKARIKKYGLASYPTIEETLTLGGEKLAVDGVVIIGEHGDYPQTAKGQTRYPRYEWFKKVVDVFEDSGRSVPVGMFQGNTLKIFVCTMRHVAGLESDDTLPAALDEDRPRLVRGQLVSRNVEARALE